jgi:uncharacterized Zn-binding protein involved in type VI secretion
MGQLVTHGDTTTTRGVVIAVASRMFEKGRRLALHGEEATCGNCKGSFKIVGTATRTRDNGRALVQHGDWVMCPCGKNRVLADSKMTYHDEGSTARTLASPVAAAAAVGAVTDATTASQYDEQIQLLTNSGTPVANTNYKIVAASGATTTGTTDAQGKTSRVSTDAAESLQIYLVS